jgi:hypothetical protein
MLPTFNVLTVDAGWAAGAAQAVIPMSIRTSNREANAKYFLSNGYSCSNFIRIVI